MRTRGRPHTQILKPTELVDLLQQGEQPSAIARRYGVSPAAVTQAIKALSRVALYDVVMGRATPAPVAMTPPARPDGPVDVLGVVLRVHERLERLEAFLESPEATAKLKLGQRLQLQLTTSERTLRWAQTFLATNEHLLNLMGAQIWMQELQQLLAEVDPALAERLRDRIRARGLVRAVPA